jgi:hypothetical protein
MLKASTRVVGHVKSCSEGPIVALRLNDSYAWPSPIIVVRIVATCRSSSPVPA